MKQNNLNTQDINSVEVIEGIQNYRLKQDPESMSNMIERMVEAKFLAPVFIESQDAAILEMKNENTLPANMKVLFHMIENNMGVTYFLAFTSLEEMYKWRNDADIPVAVVTFDDFADMISEAPADKLPGGFVIDPFGVNQIFTREQTAQIKAQKDMIENAKKQNNHFDADEEVFIGEPAEYPTMLMNEVKNYLGSQDTIKKAYFQLMCQGEVESYLFVLDFEGDKESIFNKFADAVRPHLNGKLVDLMDCKSELGANVAKSVEPFFTK